MRGRITRRVRHGRHVRIAAANRLEAALPGLSGEARRRILSRSFSHQTRAATDRRLLDRLEAARLCSRLDLEGWERIEEAERKGGGVVLLSASLGIFELLPTVLTLYKGGVEVLDSTVDQTEGGAAIPRQRQGSVTPGRRFLARLDQPAPENAPEHSINLRFLGRSFRAATLAAEKALEQGCPALPLFALLEPGERLRVVVRTPVAPADGVINKETLTRQFLAVIETEILARPEQFTWSQEGGR